jgi:hypothetical protein
MIIKQGKRIKFSNPEKSIKKEELIAETAKHKGKGIPSLTKKQLEDALRAALKLLDMVNDQDVIN